MAVTGGVLPSRPKAFARVEDSRTPEDVQLGRDPVHQPADALQRVGPPHALEAADEDLVGRLQEEHPGTVPPFVQISDHAA